VIVLGIETSTTQTTVAIGSERGTMASTLLSTGHPNHEVVVPAVENILRWSETPLSHVAGIAVGIGPGLFTGLQHLGQPLPQRAHVLGPGDAQLDHVGHGGRGR